MDRRHFVAKLVALGIAPAALIEEAEAARLASLTDVQLLDELANQINSNKYPTIAAYARAQAAATQSEELDIQQLLADVEMLKRSVSPPPSGGVGPGGGGGTTLSSPIGFFTNRSPGFFPPTNLNRYEIVSGEGPAPTGFTGLNLNYRSGISCQDGYTNISSATALANGWVMTDASGPLTNAGFGGYLADPGLPDYQLAWCNASLMYSQAHAGGGWWIDDANPVLDSISGGRWPTKYPNRAAYEVALLSFFQFVKTFADAHSLKFSSNSLVPLDDNASQTAVWWAQIGQYHHYLTSEYWLNPGGNIRRTGPEWYNHWDEHRALHTVCQTAGCGFLPLCGGGGSTVQRYQLGTFMLDWTGVRVDGAAMWTATDLYNETTDPWSTFYAQAVALGAPTGAAVKTGNVWNRAFTNGSLAVDPVNATATITGV